MADRSGRARVHRAQYARVCETCGSPFTAKLARARFCTRKCWERSRFAYVKKPRKSAAEWLELMDRPTDGCWLWPGPVTSHGYGYTRVGGTLVYGHRFSYEAVLGPIADGLEIDHLCRNRQCVRPDHLEAVTHEENLRRAIPYRAEQERRLGRCEHGDEDVYVDPTGKRVCRICRRARNKLRRAEGGQ